MLLILNENIPSMEGTFLNPKSRLPKEWEIIKKEKEITLVLDSPSSAALAFKVWPNAKKNIKQIIYAGGTLTIKDITPFAEKSIYNDPFGMESLLNSGIDIYFCLLESSDNTAKDTALDYAEHPENYDTYHCGIHVETQSHITSGKLVSDLNSDKKFNLKNAYLVYKK